MNIKKIKQKYKIGMRKLKRTLGEVNWKCKLDKKI